MSFNPPGYCPNCGDFVEEGAAACESCGSCEETGWNDEVLYDGLDLPGEEEPPLRSSSDGKLWGTVVSVGLLALLIYVFVLR